MPRIPGPSLRLQYLVEATPPERLKAFLLESLNNDAASHWHWESKMTARRWLLDLMKPLHEEASDIKHCVRCHEEFTEYSNTECPCDIDHHEHQNKEPEGHPKPDRDSEGCKITLSCCGLQLDPTEDASNSSCFIGPHTTNPIEVKYWDAGDGGERGLNQNVVSCQTQGCSKKRKADETGDLDCDDPSRSASKKLKL